MKNHIVVKKLIAYTEKVLRYCDGVSYEEFICDSKLVEACVFNLSQIGELTTRLDEPFRQTHSEIPWRFIYGLRNRIVHDYEGVNLRLIWQIITEDLEPLHENLLRIH